MSAYGLPALFQPLRRTLNGGGGTSPTAMETPFVCKTEQGQDRYVLQVGTEGYDRVARWAWRRLWQEVKTNLGRAPLLEENTVPGGVPGTAGGWELFSCLLGWSWRGGR